MKKVSVVCVTYNHEKYIAKAINSFLKQKTNFDYDILVCDDCSTDETIKIVEDICKKNKDKIKFIKRKKNIGSMNNYLDALSKVSSQYIAVCDGDDYWIDDFKLQKQVDFLDNNLDYNIVFHNTSVVDENDKYHKIFPNFKNRVIDFSLLLSYNCIPSNSVMYRNNKNLNFRNDIVPLDHYIHLKYASLGKVFCMSDVMSIYRMHSDSLWEFSSNDKKYYDFLDKNGINYLNYLNILNEDYGVSNQDLIFKTINDFLYVKISLGDYKYLDLIKKNFSCYYDSVLKHAFFPLYGKSKFKKLCYYLIFEPRKLVNKLLKK